jgi:hypothetical protein
LKGTNDLNERSKLAEGEHAFAILCGACRNRKAFNGLKLCEKMEYKSQTSGICTAHHPKRVAEEGLKKTVARR